MALVLGALAALVRPEVWPLLAVYGAWRWREDPRSRPLLAGLAVGAWALWFVPDLLTSGTLSAGGRAQGRAGTQSGLAGSLEVLGRAVPMPLFAAWPLALFATVKGRRDRRLAILGAGVLGWVAVVVAMSAVGFPGLPRFMAPAVAVAGVLAGVGLARLMASARRPPARALVALVVLALLAQGALRADELHGDMSSSARIARSHERVRDLVREIGAEPLLRCGRLAVSDVLVRNELAWELDVALARVVSFGEPSASSGAFVVGPRATPLVVSFMRSHGALLGARDEWRIYSVGCSPAAGALASRASLPPPWSQ